MSRWPAVPNGACIPDSDENTPVEAGSAFMELQLYPPGFPPSITQISCDLKRWCAALNIDSAEVDSTGNSDESGRSLAHHDHRLLRPACSLESMI
jgi:hypothetical protein